MLGMHRQILGNSLEALDWDFVGLNPVTYRILGWFGLGGTLNLIPSAGTPSTIPGCPFSLSLNNSMGSPDRWDSLTTTTRSLRKVQEKISGLSGMEIPPERLFCGVLFVLLGIHIFPLTAFDRALPPFGGNSLGVASSWV